MSSKPIARKRFGQHFLINQAIIQQIVGAISPQYADHMVEIGPGHGALTHYLLPVVSQLDLIEIDRDLVAQLKKRLATVPNINIHQADVLAFSFKQLTNNPTSLRIVGNLPYNISTPLLFKLFDELAWIKDMHFMVQKEVALRLTATASSKDYGRLSVMAQYYCDNDYLFSVPPNAFQPKPKVNSAVIRMQPKQQPTMKANDVDHFQKLVKEAFTYRRKTLHNALKKFLDSEFLQTLNIDPALRPQDISVEDYVRISNAITVR